MGMFELKKKITCKNLYRPDAYNFVLLKKGFLSAYINGKEVTFSGPCVIMLRDGLTVENVSAYRHEKEVIHFDIGFIDYALSNGMIDSGKYSQLSEAVALPPLDMFCKNEGRYNYYVPLEENEFAVICDYLEKIHECFIIDRNFPAEYLKAHFILMLEYLYRLYKRYIANPPRTANLRDTEVFMDIVLNTVYRDYRKKISLITLSGTVGINKTSVAKAFRQTIGVSASEFIIRYRIRCANLLLSSTMLTIHDIAGLCGFNSEAYFVKQYGKRTGITPAAYRRNTVRAKAELK